MGAGFFPAVPLEKLFFELQRALFGFLQLLAQFPKKCYNKKKIKLIHTPISMPTAVQKNQQGTKLPGMPEGFHFPTGEEVYDMIMGKIEPELLNANLAHLDEPYKGETADEHKSRYARYSRAFATYKTEYAKWVVNLRQSVAAYKRAVMKAAEGAEDEQETMLLKNLEDQMLTA